MQFQAGPVQFLRRFGATGLHGILGWCLAAPLAVSMVYVVSVPAVARIADQKPREGGAS